MENYEALLREAALAGDIEKIEKLLRLGVSINAVDTFNNTALLHAARRGRIDCIRYLVDNGANVNIANKNGYSPLFFSVLRGAVEEVRLLLSAGADVHQEVKSEDMPLGWYTSPFKMAISKHLHPIVELLEGYAVSR